MFPAEKAYEMATLGGARTMQLADQIGSLELGKKADIVLHDGTGVAATAQRSSTSWSGRPTVAECTRCWSMVGRVLVDDGHCTTIDEAKLWADAQRRGARRSSPAAGCPTRPSGRRGEVVAAYAASAAVDGNRHRAHCPLVGQLEPVVSAERVSRCNSIVRPYFHVHITV